MTTVPSLGETRDTSHASANIGRVITGIPDLEELASRLPILSTPANEDPLVSYLISLSNLKSADFEGNNRKLRKTVDQDKVSAGVFKLTFAFSKYLYANEHSDSTKQLLNNIVEEAIEKSPFIIPSNMREVFLPDYEESEALFPVLDWINKEAPAFQTALAVDSPDTAYGFLKSLTSIDPAQLAEPEKSATVSQEVLCRYGLLALMGKHNPEHPYYKSMDLLRAGAIDTLIAADLLSTIRGKDVADVPEQFVPLLSFVKFIEHVADRNLDEIACDRLAVALWGWPREQRALIGFLRSDMIAKITELKSIADTISGDLVIDPEQSCVEEIQASVHNLINLTNYRNFLPRKIGSRAIGSNQHSSKRKAAAQIETPVEPVEMKAEKEPVTLKCIDINGNIYDIDSPQFQKIVDHYLDSYRGMPKIAEDVQILLGRMQELDLSQVERCIKKIKSPTIVPMHEFRPSLAAGLNVNNDWAKRTRVVFTWVGPRALAIASITHREKLDQALRPFKK